MLVVEGLNQYYGGSHILRNISLEARTGKVMALLGRNGVGKTTLLRSLMGVVPVRSGTVRFEDRDLTSARPFERVRAGLAYVPQGREIFPRLTVRENLVMGLASRPTGTPIPERIFELFPVLRQMLQGRFETDRRTLLEGEVIHAHEVVLHTHALNDVVISHGVAGGLVDFTVRVDGVNMYNQRADGVILATPTGSTAYALSANGPILHPCLAGLVLVPVAPHTLSNRPIALPDNVEIEIELTEVRDAVAYFDMQSFSKLAPGDIVRVRRSAHYATLLHPAGYNYFATLRQKLHWNVMSSDPRGRA